MVELVVARTSWKKQRKGNKQGSMSGGRESKLSRVERDRATICPERNPHASGCEHEGIGLEACSMLFAGSLVRVTIPWSYTSDNNVQHYIL